MSARALACACRAAFSAAFRAIACASLLLAVAIGSGASAFAGSPELRSLLPTGGQRGTSVTFTLSGERLAGAQALLFYDAGITVTRLANTDDRTVVAECTIAADCPLGEHPLRLRTATGISECATVWVGALPIVSEVEPNGDMATAQHVSLGTTVAGIITREDTDWFAVEAKAGDRIAAEIEGMRLGRGNFDPAIAILDGRRFELAECDDSALLRQDATASVVAPADGTYYVTVREASFAGSDTSHYRLHIGRFPRPRAVWPPAVEPERATDMRWIGDVKGVPPTTVTLRAGSDRAPLFASDGDGIAPSPNLVMVSSMPVAPETIEAGKEPHAPVAYHGVLREANATNRHRFRAKAGEVLAVALYAQRLRSPLDAVIDLVAEDGTVIGTLDDTVGADPEVKGPVPKDGVYEVRVRDHRHRGGEAFVYRLEVTPVRPQLRVSLERVDNRRPQFLQSIAIPRGGRFAAMLRAERVDVAGDVTVALPTLPTGVTVRTIPQGKDLPNAPVLFEATADAPIDGGLFEVAASVGDVRGGFQQSVPLVIGPPNDTVYDETSVRRLAIAVTEAAPFRVKLIAPTTPLLRVGAKSLKVVVERDAGFSADITLHMLWNPPGVSSANAITIPASQSEGVYQLNATGDAPANTWPIALLAHAPVNGGDVWLSSELVDLAVAEQFEGGALQLAATERGKPAAVLCSLKPVRPFEGRATLTLMGLPPNAAAAPKEIGSADAEVVFDVTTKEETPVGQHRGLFCELAVPMNGEIVTHRFAFDGVLRVDAPAATATPAAAPAPAPAPAAAAPAPPRPLSRLEQLRKNAGEKKP